MTRDSKLTRLQLLRIEELRQAIAEVMLRHRAYRRALRAFRLAHARMWACSCDGKLP